MLIEQHIGLKKVRHPFLGHIVYLDMLLCTGFDSEDADFFICPSFTKRQIND